MIWNEANSDTFWLPREDAAADYAALLARCWDLLHASVPGVNVLTTTASSHDPAAFIRAVGAAYRASGRQRPLFDAAGHNPYSLFPGEPPTARHDVYVGQGDYDRLVAVLDESFAGTAQPPTPIWYLENGFQTTTVGERRRSHYSGRETVARTLDPETQAAQIAAALRLAALPASRRRVLQLPARRREAARRLAVRPALGRLETQACVRGLQGGDRRGPRRHRRLRGDSSRLTATRRRAAGLRGPTLGASSGPGSRSAGSARG